VRGQLLSEIGPGRPRSVRFGDHHRPVVPKSPRRVAPTLSKRCGEQSRPDLGQWPPASTSFPTS
jgi:hypothetical protein